MSKIFIDPIALLAIIKTADSSNPIKAADIENQLGFSERKANHNRTVRQAITHLIEDGNLIGATKKGYFYIKTLEELRHYTNELEHHIIGIRKKIKWVKENWMKAHPHRYILKKTKKSK